MRCLTVATKAIVIMKRWNGPPPEVVKRRQLQCFCCLVFIITNCTGQTDYSKVGILKNIIKKQSVGRSSRLGPVSAGSGYSCISCSWANSDLGNPLITESFEGWFQFSSQTGRDITKTIMQTPSSDLLTW